MTPFVNADGHPLNLVGIFKKQPVFLVSGGPSFASVDVEPLTEPGIITLGLNNSAKSFRPKLWTCVDDPSHFIRSIFFDPTIMKFVPYDLRDKFIFDSDKWEFTSLKVRDCPNAVYYKRNNKFNAETYLTEDTINWGAHKDHGGCRSVFLASMKILYVLGFTEVYLLGVDFKMTPEQTYHFDQSRSNGSVKGNNNSYAKMNERFHALKPIFDRAGYSVFNCNPDSGLTAFSHLPYEEALCRSRMGIDFINEKTSGLYDRAANERKNSDRRCERFVHDKWKAFPFKKLKAGMVFKLFEPDGTPVVDLGTTEWEATTSARKQSGKWEIMKRIRK